MPISIPIPTGTTFGLWTTQGIWDHIGKRIHELCRCKCGVAQFITRYDLRSGKSTGCVSCKHTGVTTHGMTGTPTYRSWYHMLERCNNRKAVGYKNYGGRGISVCNEWNEFKNFLADMGVKPTGLEIDRIDNDGNYCKENCRWTTRTENMRNTYRATKYKLI